MDPDEIDRDRYFKVYLEPFTKSISAEFLWQKKEKEK
jgi:hypothetical protein